MGQGWVGGKQDKSWEALSHLNTRDLYNFNSQHHQEEESDFFGKMKSNLQRLFSRIFFFVNYFEKQETRPKGYYHLLVIIFFCQLIGVAASARTDFSDFFSSTFLSLCHYTRITTIFTLLENLQRVTTKFSDTQFKNYVPFMRAATLFLETEKWFFYNIKAELMTGLLYCRENKLLNSHKCNSGFIYYDSAIIWIFFIFHLLFAGILMPIYTVVHSITQLTPINILRTPFSIRKTIEFVFILLLHSSTYFSSMASTLIALALSIYYFSEYFILFPIFDQKINLFYLCHLNFFTSSVIALAIHSIFSFNDDHFTPTLLITTMMMSAVLTQIDKARIQKLCCYDLNNYKEKPKEAVNNLRQIVQFAIQKNAENEMNLIGILEFHQKGCTDSFCPCQFKMKLNDKISKLHKNVQKISRIEIANTADKNLDQFVTARKNLYQDQSFEQMIASEMDLSLPHQNSLASIQNHLQSSSQISIKQENDQNLNKKISSKVVPIVGSTTNLAASPDQMSTGVKIESSQNKHHNFSISKIQEALKQENNATTINSSKIIPKKKKRGGYRKKLDTFDEEIEKIDISIMIQDQQSYRKWVLNFVDYHFDKLLRYLYLQKNYSLLIDLGMVYVFFELEIKVNYMKALFFVRKWGSTIQVKSPYFLVVEQSISDLIENQIKDRDKALKYSIKKKDQEEADTYESYEQFIVLEELLKIYNEKLKDLIEIKNSYFVTLTKGFKSYKTLFQSIDSLLSKGKLLEKRLLKNLTQLKNRSPHLFRLLFTFYIIIYQDVKRAFLCDQQYNKLTGEGENQVEEFVATHSLTCDAMVNGKVSTIIAHFRERQGKIIKYSASAPGFFGYSRIEFQSLSTLNQLMPLSISSRHDLFIQRFIEEGKSKVLRTYRAVFVKDRDGFLFESTLYLNYFFEMKDDLLFSAFMMKKKKKSNIALLNKQGFIDGVSLSFLQFCQLMCPEMTLSTLIGSSIMIIIPDMLTILRECSKEKSFKVHSHKVVMNISSESHTLMHKFKALWKREKKLSRLMNTIAIIQQEGEDIQDQDSLFEFQLLINVFIDSFDLIIGSSFSAVAVEIMSITPTKSFQLKCIEEEKEARRKEKCNLREQDENILSGNLQNIHCEEEDLEPSSQNTHKKGDHLFYSQNKTTSLFQSIKSKDSRDCGNNQQQESSLSIYSQSITKDFTVNPSTSIKSNSQISIYKNTKKVNVKVLDKDEQQLFLQIQEDPLVQNNSKEQAPQAKIKQQNLVKNNLSPSIPFSQSKLLSSVTTFKNTSNARNLKEQKKEDKKTQKKQSPFMNELLPSSFNIKKQSKQLETENNTSFSELNNQHEDRNTDHKVNQKLSLSEELDVECIRNNTNNAIREEKSSSNYYENLSFKQKYNQQQKEGDNFSNSQIAKSHSILPNGLYSPPSNSQGAVFSPVGSQAQSFNMLGSNSNMLNVYNYQIPSSRRNLKIKEYDNYESFQTNLMEEITEFNQLQSIVPIPQNNKEQIYDQSAFSENHKIQNSISKEESEVHKIIPKKSFLKRTSDFLQKRMKKQSLKNSLLQNQESITIPIKKNSKIRILRQIQDMVDRNNNIDQTCLLTDDSNDNKTNHDENDLNLNSSFFQVKESEENFEDEESNQSQASKSISIQASNISGEVNSTSLKISKLYKAIDLIPNPRSLIFVNFLMLLFLSLQIFSIISSIIFIDNQILKAFDKMDILELEQHFSFSVTQCLMINAKEQQKKQKSEEEIYYYDQIILNSQYKIKEVQTLLELNNIKDFQEIELQNLISINDNKISMRNGLAVIQSSIYLCFDNGKLIFNIRQSALYSFQLFKSLHNLSKQSIESASILISDSIQYSYILMIILLFVQIIFAISLLIIEFNCRKYLIHFLFISTRITQEDSYFEIFKLRNVIDKLNQSDDAYLRFSFLTEGSNKQVKLLQQSSRSKESSLLFNKVKNKSFGMTLITALILFILLFGVTHSGIVKYSKKENTLILHFIQVYLFEDKQFTSIQIPFEVSKKFLLNLGSLNMLAYSSLLLTNGDIGQSESESYILENIQKLKSYYFEEYQSIPLKCQGCSFTSMLTSANEQDACNLFSDDGINELFCQQSDVKLGLLSSLRLFFTAIETSERSSSQFNLFSLLLRLLDILSDEIQPSPQAALHESTFTILATRIFGYCGLLILYIWISYLFYFSVNKDLHNVKQAVRLLPKRILAEDNSTFQLISHRVQ